MPEPILSFTFLILLGLIVVIQIYLNDSWLTTRKITGVSLNLEVPYAATNSFKVLRHMVIATSHFLLFIGSFMFSLW